MDNMEKNTLKTLCILIVSLLCSVFVQAQNKPAFEKKISLNQNTWSSRQISENEINRFSDLVFHPNETSFPYSVNSSLMDTIPPRMNKLDKLKEALKDTNEVRKDTPIPDAKKERTKETDVKANVVPTDTTYKQILVQDSSAHIYNEYRGLLSDDPLYNTKAPLWQPIMKVLGQNVLVNLVDHYFFGYDWAVVGFNSWNRTALKSGFPWSNGWKWDNDRFGNNFFLHPYTGAGYFNSARASGYNFWESSIFVFGGAYTYKLFGENGGPTRQPERNDLIATTLGGMFAGEVLYRLSSIALDERTVGIERYGREFLALLLSPGRAFTRFTNGKMFAHNTEEVYQKEPTDVVISAGGNVVNDVKSFGTGPIGFYLNADFDYGKPFEERSRKPYDYFRLRADLNFGVGRKWIDNIVGYGILTGTNVKVGDAPMLIGLTQGFEYWDNKAFELCTMSFGGAVITMVPLGKGTNLFIDFHVAVIPFAGNSTQVITDTSQGRDYNFSGGAQTKCDITLKVSDIFSATLLSYYYWISTYVGPSGNNYMGIIKPRFEFHLFSIVGIGFEDEIIYENLYLRDFPGVSKVYTQQRLFLTLYLADFAHNK
jgi:hypothetical protein